MMLKQRWQSLQQAEPKLRIRDAAQRLNVSELELLETRSGIEVTRLSTNPKQLVSSLHRLGRVMSLVRNNACVHETRGRFAEYTGGNADVGLFLGEQDLRMFFKYWNHMYSVTQDQRRSIQVFDQSGTAVIKFYAQEDTDMSAWEALVSALQHEDQTTPTSVQPYPAADIPSSNGTAEELTARWLAMTDIHQFHGILKDMGISRQQAFEWVDDQYACQLENNAIEHVFTEACHDNIPTIEFVHNRGAVQIHTDVNINLVRMGAWFNVMDPNFTLHLDTSLIHQVWALRRPADSGMVSSIEALDQHGNVILQLFGKRTEGQPERYDWQSLVLECMARHAIQKEVTKV
ncbi:hemin-degrading factor [Gynuella sunshinyii]|uniref:Putative heme degradation protein n=1 Tax=Gynuella sunshinyii YC6258 TaxID=1445510 RepID=A0A0C5VWS9_9GAMM|nr:hemin-degrading factor [Gynuella sunshinyii]AJQ94909.1 putative heme degradation protein [Gynuella sunshinyii YC6258]